MPCIDWQYVDPIIQIEEYLETFGIGKDQIGLVIGPRIDAECGTVQLEVNLRVLEDEEDLYAVDGVFAADEDDWIDYLDEVYPTLIDRFEEEFSESQLQYYEPEVDK
jgi:hypothetical protein